MTEGVKKLWFRLLVLLAGIDIQIKKHMHDRVAWMIYVLASNMVDSII